MNSFKAAIQSETPVLVDFFATWCGPCKAMVPVLTQLKERQGDKLRIIKIDIDKAKQTATELAIQGVPTFMIYKSGKLLWRQSGMQTVAQIEAVLAGVR